MNGRLEGRVAWISGATSGIGAGIARRFAAEGASVAIVGIQVEAGESLASDLVAAGAQALFIECDVAQEAQVKASIAETVAQLGGLQVLVNNAGIVHVKRLHEYAEFEWDRLMAVNLKSIFFSVKHGLPHLRKNHASTIVNVGSVSSFVGQYATPAYTASKGAVLQLSRSIALDYAADGVRCNCVCPGITDTPLLREHLNTKPDPDAALAARLRRVPLGVALSPDDVARAVLYLASDDSAGVTGTALIVDGGYLAAAEWDRPSSSQ